jgi:Mg-chelatase subunit ChlD
VRKRERDSTPGVHVFEAALPPGADTFIELREPPRNVLFLWDTSASVGPFRQVIYNSLTAYAEDLVPGRDTANFLPFGARRPLLRDWYGEPYLLQTILNDFPRGVGSSSAERAQFDAARALAARAGTKAIVMVTDASTPRNDQMWDAYKEVQPRVFTLKVSSNSPVGASAIIEEDLMQDWSRVNGGHYAYLSSEGEMEVAFDRAATLLRRPAHYTLTLATEQREAPGPGSLQVVAGSGVRGAATTSAVELILDASGSMLQRMEGRRRIDIAKDVLSGALREHIPAGTPTALRVFGHRTPNACETDLDIPLQPLDTKKAIAQLASIEAKNLARTPIAASLAEVAKDLGKAGTNAVVVLVTDGEETCDGDPAAEIEKLAQAGFAISLNIVGFAIDDAALAARFESWAESGGGRYFAANDAAGLNDAVAQALAMPYTVYDRNGEPVAEGSVGSAAVEVEQGVYRVVVGTTPPRVFKDVEVPGEKAIRLQL